MDKKWEESLEGLTQDWGTMPPAFKEMIKGLPRELQEISEQIKFKNNSEIKFQIVGIEQEKERTSFQIQVRGIESSNKVTDAKFRLIWSYLLSPECFHLYRWEKNEHSQDYEFVYRFGLKLGSVSLGKVLIAIMYNIQIPELS